MPIAISGTNGVTLSGQFDSASSFGFKNRIINGAMVIDQRNAGASVTPTQGTYTLDRWSIGASQTNKITIQRNAGSITVPSGFTNYLGVTSSSAYAITASDHFEVSQCIEGFNVSDLGFGTSYASAVTISFWVYSSLTGTFGGSLCNSDGSRSYPFSYTVSSANTWTKVSLSILGDTTGTWATNNTTGMLLRFGLGVGSTYSGTAGAWTGSNIISATGATSVVGTNGATFYITGVQLEKGSTATSFDYRPYGTELALCQRYYEHSYDGATNFGTNGMILTTVPAVSNAYIPIQFKVTKRGTPTMVAYDSLNNVGKINTPAGSNQTFFGFERIGYSSVQLTTNSIASAGAVWVGWSASSEL